MTSQPSLLCVCVCVCVSEREREREKERESCCLTSSLPLSLCAEPGLPAEVHTDEVEEDRVGVDTRERTLGTRAAFSSGQVDAGHTRGYIRT